MERIYTIGITDASPITNDKLFGGFTPFVSSCTKKRTDPKEVFAQAKSIIVVLVPYACETYFSNLSSLGVCDDYHEIVKGILKNEANILTKTFPSLEYKIFVDSPNLCERSLAVRAGLCFFGKNNLCISPKYGSRFNIGLLLTNLYAEKFNITTDYVTDSCPDECDLCIKACPNGAIKEGEPLNVHRCISYLTQKDELDSGEKKLLHGQLFGCDICQTVCPKNLKHLLFYACPAEVVKLNDDKLYSLFKRTAMSWKLKLFKRNAGIIHDAKELIN